MINCNVYIQRLYFFKKDTFTQCQFVMLTFVSFHNWLLLFCLPFSSILFNEQCRYKYPLVDFFLFSLVQLFSLLKHSQYYFMQQNEIYKSFEWQNIIYNFQIHVDIHLGDETPLTLTVYFIIYGNCPGEVIYSLKITELYCLTN